MAYILHIETSSKICSVAISNDEQLVSIIEDNNENSHAARLTSIIEQAINEANIRYQDLSAISFSCGPGSYTGLRIGLSTAKGLAYSLEKPLIFVNTLESLLDEMIYNYVDKEAIYCPMIDARRMEVYTMTADFEKKIILPIQPYILTESSNELFLEERKLVVAGDAKNKAQSLLYAKNIIYLNIENCSSKFMIRLAFEKYKKNEFENLAYCEPYYLKKPTIK
jgi:tRNA threonylcarbamoyladenosine biosynthesis protein TsaB